MVQARQDVSLEDCWKTEALFPSWEAWEREFAAVPKGTIARFQGKLGKKEVLKEAMDTMCGIERKLSKLYTYAHLKHDEDLAEEVAKSAYNRAIAALHAFGSETAWVDPELLSVPESLFSDPLISLYEVRLKKVARRKPHTLSQEGEELLAIAQPALQASRKAFSALNDSDFVFGEVLDSEGKAHPLTHATYRLYMRSPDRKLRENCFLTLHRKFGDHGNTLCELLNGEVQAHLFDARARKFTSCLDAALFPHAIDTSVYRNLIETVNANLHVFHRYVALRKAVLGVEELHIYDMQVPLVAEVESKISFSDAVDMVIESVEPLGKEYQNALRKGLVEERWVDRYENKNKRSGAYSSGCYDSSPYILMNYTDDLRDAFTLAHEAGHSMHSLSSWRNQEYPNADYPIFVAEVASTFNEELLFQHLLKKTKSREEKLFLLSQKLEDLRNTFFRQTMFAEFELWLHESAEKGEPLTPKRMNDAFYALNAKYFGKDVVMDKEVAYEWARIPHFYYGYYVYQYATGISAALALSEKVQHGGVEAYLTFLKSGGSAYPIELLTRAGVDMRQPEAVQATLRKFTELLEQFEELNLLVGNGPFKLH